MGSDLPQQTYHGTERETLVSALEYYRAVFARKMDGLSGEQLGFSIPPSEMTLGGLWFHMAFVEDIWFQYRFRGDAIPEPFASAPFAEDPDWELHSGHLRSRDELATAWESAVERSRAALDRCASLSEETLTADQNGEQRSVRWMLVHLIEEYARHCGHADLLRESIDGTTGD